MKQLLALLLTFLTLSLSACNAPASQITSSTSGTSSDEPSSEKDAEAECLESPGGLFDYRNGGIRGDQLPCEIQAASAHLASLGTNVPRSDPEFYLLYGDIVSEEMQAEYLQWMGLLIDSFGGYDRWVHAIYEAGSPSSENSRVLDGLLRLGYFGFAEPSIDLVYDRRGCLAGFFTGPDPLRDEYSICNQPEHWTDPDREFHRDMVGNLYFSYEILHEFAHEYHHHVQKAHELAKRGAGGNGPGAPIPPDGFSPAWYIEGSAGLSPSWILRDHFDDLLLSQRLGLTYQQVVEENLSPGRLLGSDYGCSDYSVREFQESVPGPTGFRLTKAQEVYEGQRADVFGYEEPNQAWGCLNLYFMHLTSPQTLFVSFLADQWTLGWHGSFEKHTGMTMDDFYVEFEKEMMAVSLAADNGLPAWMSLPDEKFSEVVDYWSIKSGPLS